MIEKFIVALKEEIIIIDEIWIDFETKTTEKYTRNVMNTSGPHNNHANKARFSYSINIFVQNLVIIYVSRIEKIMQNILIYELLLLDDDFNNISMSDFIKKHEKSLFSKGFYHHVKQLKSKIPQLNFENHLNKIKKRYDEYNFLKHGFGSSFIEFSKDYKLNGLNPIDIPVKFFLTRTNKVIDTNFYIQELKEFKESCNTFIYEIIDHYNKKQRA